MAIDSQIIQQGPSWYVMTQEGRVGPLDSEDEAVAYTKLLRLASAAGRETACTEDECLI